MRKRCRRWTRILFIEHARRKHGDRFDYSLLPEKIHSETRIRLICRDCETQFETTVTAHLRQKLGCLTCAHYQPISYDILLDKAQSIYAGVHNCSLITPAHIKNMKSKIPLLCVREECKYNIIPWLTRIDFFLQGRSRCPSCNNHDTITLEEFLIQGARIHNDMIDYGEVNTIAGYTSQILLKCKVPGCWNGIQPWVTTVRYHLQPSAGCPTCRGYTPWTYDYFMFRSRAIHGESVDRSEIKETDFTDGIQSRMKLRCTTCQCTWTDTIRIHILDGKRCPHCNNHQSKGEVRCAEILRKMKIVFEPQVRWVENKHYSFDFGFSIGEQKYVLEFDGMQHFRRAPGFHKTQENFNAQVHRDIVKNRLALRNGYRVIRLAYKAYNSVEYHLQQALNSSKSTPYFSHPTLYKEVYYHFLTTCPLVLV